MSEPTEARKVECWGGPLDGLVLDTRIMFQQGDWVTIPCRVVRGMWCACTDKRAEGCAIYQLPAGEDMMIYEGFIR